MTGCFRRFVGIVVGAVVLLALAGVTACGKPAQPGGLPPAPTPGSAAPSSPSASPSGPLTPPAPVTVGTPEQQIEAQARLFITEVLPAAYLATPDRRKAILGPFTIEPALSLYLKTMSELDSQGKIRRGASVILSQTVQRSGNTALFTSCVDTSHGGLYDKQSGQQLTKGVPRQVLLATLKFDGKKVWKVSGSENPKKRC